MNDTTTLVALPGRIPIISPLLHFLAMPVLMFWRHSFGYSFLRPKSVFLACAFGTALGCYMVFHEPSLKAAFGDLAVFAALVSGLYVIHLIRAIGSEAAQVAGHDQYSGISWLLALVPAKRRVRATIYVHSIIEPALTAILGALAIVCGFGWLGWILIFAGASLSVKEALNAWIGVRDKKVIADKMDDVQERMPEVGQNTAAHPLKEGVRKKREVRTRTTPPVDQDETHHARVLRLIPPYTLEAATANYRLLIKDVHPDYHGETFNANKLAIELNEAMAYFRRNIQE